MRRYFNLIPKFSFHPTVFQFSCLSFLCIALIFRSLSYLPCLRFCASDLPSVVNIFYHFLFSFKRKCCYFCTCLYLLPLPVFKKGTSPDLLFSETIFEYPSLPFKPWRYPLSISWSTEVDFSNYSLLRRRLFLCLQRKWVYRYWYNILQWHSGLLQEVWQN